MRLGPGTLLAHYRILGSLGAGGMGEVYRARDDRLDRDVAIKTLAADVASDPERIDRFAREAKAAAALNHPNILTVYDVGVHDRHPFIVTEVLEGRTLRDVLTTGRPQPSEAVDWTLQVCDALAAAHEAGIVHRDLKPENLFVTSTGLVKVLDFGLAKLVEPPDAMTAHETTTALTVAGTMLGTAGYMAPEQVAGRPCDRRADIFSLGCVLYELISGRRAFQGSSTVEKLSAILKDDPPSLEGQAGIPDGVARIATRCLQKAPAARFQSARDLAFALTEAAGRPRRSGFRKQAVAGVVLLFAATLLTTWLLKTRKTAPAVEEGPSRVVVLPFENLSQQPTDAWLAGAFADALTLNLRSAEHLLLVDRARVLELSRAAPSKDAAEEVQRIVKTLDVRYYVSGSYQHSGDAIRVVARLIDTANHSIVLQEGETDRFENLLALQDNLGRRFAAALNRSPATSASPGTRSLAAYQAFSEANDLYLAARYREAAERLESAVQVDANYADAWALLGKAYGRLAAVSTREASTPVDVLDRGLRAANQAVKLKPALYEAQVAMAIIHRANGDREPWQKAARTAIDLNPRMAEAYALLGDVFFAGPSWGCGRPRDGEMAERLYRKAIEIDQRWSVARANLVYHVSWLGRDEEALQLAEQANRTIPGNVGVMRARATAFLFLGNTQETETQLREILALGTKSVQDEWELAGVELLKGNRAEAEQRFAAVIALGPPTLRNLDTARLYAVAGDFNSAGRHVEAAARAEAACRAFVDTSPAFAALRAADRSPR